MMTSALARGATVMSFFEMVQQCVFESCARLTNHSYCRSCNHCPKSLVGYAFIPLPAVMLSPTKHTARPLWIAHSRYLRSVVLKSESWDMRSMPLLIRIAQRWPLRLLTTFRVVDSAR